MIDRTISVKIQRTEEISAEAAQQIAESALEWLDSHGWMLIRKPGQKPSDADYQELATRFVEDW